MTENTPPDDDDVTCKQTLVELFFNYFGKGMQAAFGGDTTAAKELR